MPKWLHKTLKFFGLRKGNNPNTPGAWRKFKFPRFGNMKTGKGLARFNINIRNNVNPTGRRINFPTKRTINRDILTGGANISGLPNASTPVTGLSNGFNPQNAIVGLNYKVKSTIMFGKKEYAPEVKRIMNNNWLNTPINVKVITEEEAKTITTQFLSDNKSAIVPIVRSLSDVSRGSSLGQSHPTLIDPDNTYVAYSTARNDSPKLKVTTNYFVAYLIAHEALHQFQMKCDASLGSHTNGWPNLNSDGDFISENSFQTKIKINGLKNAAEWIPFNMQQRLNNWFKPMPIKP